MKYVAISIVVFVSVFFVGSCSDKRAANAQAYTLSDCSMLRGDIERCENGEVVCYILKSNAILREGAFGGISCLRK